MQPPERGARPGAGRGAGRGRDNFADALLCRGTYQEKPAAALTPGLEVCGGCSRPARPSPDRAGPAGDRPARAAPRRPGRAGVGRARPTCSPAPDDLDDESAAALPVTYQTGWFGLHRRARLRPGETVLVHAGAGGVGTAAIQLAVARGAGSSPRPAARPRSSCVRALGADIAVDYRARLRGGDQRGDRTGAAPTSSTTRSAATPSTGRRSASRSRAGSSSSASPAGGSPDARPTTCWSRTTAILGLHWGLYQSKDPQLIRHCHAQLSSGSSPRAPSGRWSASGSGWTRCPPGCSGSPTAARWAGLSSSLEP